MNESNKFMYHEVDFILPAHRFNIRFSYVSKKGLPFIREFILRLVHISSITPLQLAKYFDLSKREVDEAIGDLIERGELTYLDDGKIALTGTSTAYFTSMGSVPEVSTVSEATSLPTSRSRIVTQHSWTQQAEPDSIPQAIQHTGYRRS